MFRGANAINLDAKGRISIPSRYRARLDEACSGQLVVTIDLIDPCLLLFPLPAWEALESRLRQFSNTDPVHRRIKRMLLGYATDVEMNATGRILLSAELREHAKLEKQVMLAGQGETFQIWDEANWHAKIDEDIEAHSSDQVDLDALPDLAF